MATNRAQMHQFTPMMAIVMALTLTLWGCSGCGSQQHTATEPLTAAPTGAQGQVSEQKHDQDEGRGKGKRMRPHGDSVSLPLVSEPMPPWVLEEEAPREMARGSDRGQAGTTTPRAAAPVAARPQTRPHRQARTARKQHRSPAVGMGISTLGMGGGGGVGTGYGRGAGALRGRGVLAARSPEPPRWNREAYEHVKDNDFKTVQDSPLSTFSIDVDTASYSNVRRFLRDGRRPPADAVRVEELINYFSYDYPKQRSAAPFSVHTEVASAPWQPDHRLVHIGLKGKEMQRGETPARNLVFLVDVSGSMGSPDKLPLLKRGLKMLARDLRSQDRIAMVVYAGASGLALPATPGNRRIEVLDALDRLRSGGSTNGAQGIQLAYQVAQENFIKGGINRVILATDGDFNVGVTSQGELTRLIETKRESGVFLTVLGFGRGNLQDSRMEALADKGNGNYAYIDSDQEAHKVLVREAGSTLVTIAKDVKLQVEFNPELVANYRLIGYENRKLATRDFNDDKKDAGEIGAGHTVTALYEVVLHGRGDGRPEVDALKYQRDRALTAAAASGELLTVKLRYKEPTGARSRLLSRVVKESGGSLDQASDNFRFSAAVAGFGMLLRDSKHRGQASIEMLQQLARSGLGHDRFGDRRELLELMQRAQRLGVGREG